MLIKITEFSEDKNRVIDSKRLKKIIYFLDFPFCIGGSNKVLLTQAYIMSKKGYKVIVVIPNDENGIHSPEYDKICQNYGVCTKTARYSISVSMEGIDIVDVWERYEEIFQLLREEKADLIHSTQINVTVELASRELGIPHIMNIYQTDLETFNLKWMNVYPLYHSADSQLFSNRWGQGLSIPSKCIRVAYENNCKKVFDNIEHTTLKILSIGILTERKNQLEIIKFILLCKKNHMQVSLTILGNSNTPYGKLCKDFVRINELEDDVSFPGFVSNIEEYFVQMDLMILASKVESYPGVIVESMANKVPVLSTPVAGVPELLQDGYNGFLTQGFCGEDIYRSFIQYMIYKNNGEIKSIINQAYKTYLQYHSYKVVGDNLEKYYKWILSDYLKKAEYISIDTVKRVFERFVREKSIDCMSPYTKKSIWFLYHLSRKIAHKEIKKIGIWGAGSFGKIALEWIKILDFSNCFIGFIDTYKEGKYLEYPIIRPDKRLIEACDIILLAMGDENNCIKIMQYLEGFGKKRNKDYFMIVNAPIRI